MEFPTNNVLEVFGSHASFIFCKTLFEWVKNDPTGCKGISRKKSSFLLVPFYMISVKK